MAIIDFDSPAKKAFSRGFMKGLTAPATLFGVDYAPPVPTIEKVHVPGSPDSLYIDGERITTAIYSAVNRYDKKKSR